MKRDCIHGHLARSCNICELEAERDLLRSKLQIAVEALEWIEKGKAHIGNDANGNVFGLPDVVMCRNRAKEALKRIEGVKGD